MNITEDDNAITIQIRVIPRSSRDEIVGEQEGALKVKLTAPPVEGAANTELIKLLSKKLGVPKSSISIVSGEASRSKRLRIVGVTAEQFRNAIAPF